jgi:hAT family C-terminal dimerisation region
VILIFSYDPKFRITEQFAVKTMFLTDFEEFIRTQRRCESPNVMESVESGGLVQFYDAVAVDEGHVYGTVEGLTFLEDTSCRQLKDLQKYPRIRSYFKKKYCCLTSSATVERFFSVAKLVLRDNRNCLSDTHFEVLAIFKANMK